MRNKRLLCSILILFFAICTVSTVNIKKVFAGQIPTDIKIGLFYGNSAVSTINAESDGGFNVYSVNGDDDVELELHISTEKQISIHYDVTSNEYVILSNKSEELGRVSGDAEYVMVTPISSLKCKTIKIGKRLYRGSMLINNKNVKAGRINVINKVNLEEYLYSVVPSEMPASWKIEALKAQAIAARTYAVKHMGKHSKYGFDLCNSVDCQAYNGYSAENPKYPNSNKAVDDTRGQLIYYKNQLIDAVFFSCSGGRTESSENVWGTAVPYLKGVDDSYEPKNASYSSWIQEITSSQLKSILKAKKVDIGDIINCKADSVSDNGRVLSLTVIGTSGTKTYKESSISALLGLKSTCFTIKIKKTTVSNSGTSVSDNQTDSISDVVYDNENTGKGPVSNLEFSIDINGKGWGHGIGMSQWGAEGMAEAGKNYIQILKHYYTGVSISNAH